MTKISLPRKKHSHRCQICNSGVYCYKTQCVKPQSVTACESCKDHLRRLGVLTVERNRLLTEGRAAVKDWRRINYD